MDLRRDLRRRAALEVPGPVPRAPRLQPVELRPRPCFLLLGPERGRSRSGGGRCRRARLALVLIVAGGFAILGRLHLTGSPSASGSPSRPDRRARGERAHDDGRVARRADRGAEFWWTLVDLAGDPRLPLLHDHRPADDPGEHCGATRVRDRGRAARDAADRAVHDRVRGEGRRARALFLACAARPLLCCSVRRGSSRASRRGRSREASGRAAFALAGAATFCRARGRRGHPGPAGGGNDVRARRGGAASGDHDRRLAGIAPIGRRRRGGSRATSSPISATRPTRCADATMTTRRSVRPATGWRRSGSRSASRKAGRSWFPCTTREGSDSRSSRGRPGAADGRRTARGNVVTATYGETRSVDAGKMAAGRSGGRWSSRSTAAATGSRSRVAGRPPPPAIPRPVELQRARRDLARGRRGRGRPRLPTRRISLRHVQRHDVDDGRRPLLARLRRRRLARPLRRQLVHRHRVRRLGRAGRPAPDALFRNVTGRSRTSVALGGRLPLRGNGCVAADFDLDGHTDLYVTTAGYNVATDGYDALLWNDGDGTFTEGPDRQGLTAAGLARGSRGRRRERRRAPRSVRGRLHGPQRHRPVGRRASRPITAPCAICCTSTRGRTRTAARLSRGRENAGIESTGSRTASERSSRLRPRRAPRPVRRPTMRIRTSSTGTSHGQELSASASMRSRSERRSTTRTPAWASPPPTTASTGGPTCRHERPPTVARGVSKSTGSRAVTAFADDRPSSRWSSARARRAGAVVGRSRPRRRPRPRRRERGDPSHGPRPERQRVRVLENVASGDPASTQFAAADAGLGKTPRVNGRGLAAADYDNDGDIDVAINSVGGRLLLLRNDGARGHWLESGSGGSPQAPS